MKPRAPAPDRRTGVVIRRAIPQKIVRAGQWLWIDYVCSAVIFLTRTASNFQRARTMNINPTPEESKEEPLSGSRWRHLPNLLSVSRILLVPLIVWLSLNQEHLWALVLFGVAAATDFLDGYLASRFGWKTYLGSILDPVADRVFVLCLIPLLWYFDAIGPLYTVLIVFRYLVQLSVLPVFLLWLKRPINVVPDGATKFAALIVFLVLGMGFVDLWVIELLDESTGADEIFERTLGALTFIGCLSELWVLYKFLPRYWKVIRREYDRFH